jgi:hypothetical protein
MAEGLITQVPYSQDISDIDTTISYEDPLPSTLKFELRGTQFIIARETLVFHSCHCITPTNSDGVSMSFH